LAYAGRAQTLSLHHQRRGGGGPFGVPWHPLKQSALHPETVNY